MSYSTGMVEQFWTLYRGRDDAYGGDEGLAIRRPFTVEVARAHLEGTSGCGVYPSFHNDGRLWTRWGCCDIDTGDWDEAYALAFTLDAMQMHPVVERSRSKGWHIWVHVDGVVEAWVMRRALKVAYGIIDLPAREANPKSESLAPSQLGNYVRLPYKGGAGGPLVRQVCLGGWDSVSDGEPMPLSDFLHEVQPVSGCVLSGHASRWYEPPRRLNGLAPPGEVTDEAAEQLGAILGPSLKRLMFDGPKSMGKRSDGLMALARGAALRQMEPKDVFRVVDYADRKWGKYWERQDGEAYIMDIVERAFR